MYMHLLSLLYVLALSNWWIINQCFQHNLNIRFSPTPYRLSTVYNANCIAVITGGKVVEVGTHAQLIAKKGIYYKLNRYQMQANEGGGAARGGGAGEEVEKAEVY